MGNSSAREDLQRTVKQLHALSVLLGTGNSHRYRLFNHYFINYNEVFSSKIDRLVTMESIECGLIKLNLGVICPLLLNCILSCTFYKTAYSICILRIVFQFFELAFYNLYICS